MFKKKRKTRLEVLQILGLEKDPQSALHQSPLVNYLVGEKLTRWQVDFIIKMQSFNLAMLPAVSLLGSGQFILILVTTLLWCGDPALQWKACRVAAVMLIYVGLIKAVMRGPRPYWISDKIKTLDPTLETSYGFPSGHTSGAVCVFGVLFFHYFAGYETTMLPWVIWASLVIWIGASRVYTGAHFLHDVIGGALIGAGVLYQELYLKLGKGSEPQSLTESVFLFIFGVVGFVGVILSTKWSRHNKDKGIRLKLVYEGITGSGFCFGLSLSHLMTSLGNPSHIHNVHLTQINNFFIWLLGSETVAKGGDKVTSLFVCSSNLDPDNKIFRTGGFDGLQCIFGFLIVIIVSSLVKILPEKPDGTRSVPVLFLSMLCFAFILFWATWLYPFLLLCV